MEVAVASILTALVAIALRRTPAGMAKPATRGTLSLGGAQLVVVEAAGGELVLDLFGGTGQWFAADDAGVVDTGVVAGTPILTFKASFDSGVDGSALRLLTRWCVEAADLHVVVEVDGPSPLDPASQVALSDGVRAVTLRAPAA